MNKETEQRARIFLIDDHPAVRQGVRMLLSQDAHVVCGEAGNRDEALIGIGSSAAEMALLDLSLGEESGLELINDLETRGVRVLVYSMHEDADTIERAFSAGAAGYVSKREPVDVLLTAVTDLMAGRRHLSPLAAQSLASRAIESPAARQEAQLSEREREILALFGQGESNADIAAALAISVRTVETYCSRIITKMELDGMKALRRYAIQNRLP